MTGPHVKCKTCGKEAAMYPNEEADGYVLSWRLPGGWWTQGSTEKTRRKDGQVVAYCSLDHIEVEDPNGVLHKSEKALAWPYS
jgi:hypothetical protein